MKFFLTLIIGVFFVTFFSGCETADTTSTSSSAIPWNKPASWEGTGALGGLGFQGTH